jgi:hypothetical protein
MANMICPNSIGKAACRPVRAAVGPAGATGAQGPQGNTGPQGLIGNPGATGATGLTGAVGPQGLMGLTGLQGPAGTNGTNGTNGTGFNFRNAFDNSATYAAYDVVTYSGSSYDATTAIAPGGGTPDTNPGWSLMAQAGTAGAAGAVGPAGPTGATGPIGATGATGTAGPQGNTGNAGPQGPAGPTTAAAVCSVLYPNLPAAYCAAAPNTPKFVFVTANSFTGNLGGVVGGNAKCQTEATAAGLPGTYKAWLSDSLGNYPAATDAFTHSSLPYVTPDPGLTTVASNWNQLISGSLQNSISFIATGSAAPQEQVWTATNNNGTASTSNCTNWTTNSTNFGVPAGYDYPPTTVWSNGGSNEPYCNSALPLYCFQQ